MCRAAADPHALPMPVKLSQPEVSATANRSDCFYVAWQLPKYELADAADAQYEIRYRAAEEGAWVQVSSRGRGHPFEQLSCGRAWPPAPPQSWAHGGWIQPLALRLVPLHPAGPARCCWLLLVPGAAGKSPAQLPGTTGSCKGRGPSVPCSPTGGGSGEPAGRRRSLSLHHLHRAGARPLPSRCLPLERGGPVLERLEPGEIRHHPAHGYATAPCHVAAAGAPNGLFPHLSPSLSLDVDGASWPPPGTPLQDRGHSPMGDQSSPCHPPTRERCPRGPRS